MWLFITCKINSWLFSRHTTERCVLKVRHGPDAASFLASVSITVHKWPPTKPSQFTCSWLFLFPCTSSYLQILIPCFCFPESSLSLFFIWEICLSNGSSDFASSEMAYLNSPSGLRIPSSVIPQHLDTLALEHLLHFPVTILLHILLCHFNITIQR